MILNVGAPHPGVRVDLVEEDGDAGNALWITFDFLKSRYRITVTMDPE